jgi:hypothetical protein
MLIHCNKRSGRSKVEPNRATSLRSRERTERPILFRNHPCLLLLLIATGIGHAQDNRATALPPILFECDAAPNPVTCAAWIWNGQQYDATWEDGAVGQMTVTSGNSSSLVIHRADTTGAVAGLTGTYTGTWNGKAVIDAKFIWTFRGNTTNWTWQTLPTTVPANCVPPGYIKNWYTSPLTAYVFAAEPKSDGSAMNTAHELNDLRNKGRPWPAIGRFRTTRDENCFNAVAYGFGSHLTVALFADGSAFGDRQEINAIMSARAKAEREYHQLATQVCSLAQQGLGLSEIAAAINSQHPPDSPALNLLNHNLGKPPRTPEDGKLRIINAIKELQDMRAGLLDPVKDENGKLYIDEKPEEKPDAKPCPLP